MTSQVTTIAHGALLLANFAWFGAGFVQFAFRSRAAFLGGIQRRPGEPRPTHIDHAADIFKYLGAMGGSLALSTVPKLMNLLRDRHETLSYLFWVWGAGHGSQAITTLSVVAPSGRWRWQGLGLGLITYLDLFLWSANWAAWWIDR